MYYGGIHPNEKCFDHNSDYGKAMDTIAKNEELLTNALTGKEKELFLDITNAWGELLGIDACETFVMGFRLGASFTLDTFINTDNEFKSIIKED